MHKVRNTLVAAGALVCATLCGCSVSVGSTPTVSAADLQNDIKDRLTKAGETPESVTCEDDLEGVVDKTTRCEVVLSATNAFEPIIKVTGVEGTTVSYEMTPALSQQQLEKAVGALVEENSSEPVDAVSCAGGLAGRVGITAKCTVDGGGESMDTVVKVTKVSGLLMNFEVNQA
jgi:hypothetical protein